MKIHMCSIHVTDPAHAYRFYTDVLGFETTLAMAEHNLFVINAPGQDMGLLLEPSGDNPLATAWLAGQREQNMPVIVLSTPDLASETQRLTEAGVEFVGESFSDASGAYINFDDSVGNLVQLHQPA